MEWRVSLARRLGLTLVVAAVIAVVFVFAPTQAAAQAVTGVQHVEVVRMRRQGSTATAVGDVLTVGRLEIVRLENDPNYPDHGVLTVEPWSS